MTNDHCIACGSNLPPKPLYDRYARCVNCGMTRLATIPTEEELQEWYSVEYYQGAEHKDYAQDKAVWQKNFRRRVQTLRDFVPAEGKLFEIGAAYGFFLELAQQYWQVRGVEKVADAARYAREQLRLNVTDEDFLSLNIPSNEYDAVCMWDTIEHLREPHLFIEKVSRILKPGGVICITTGDVGSVLARLQGAGWRLLHTPTHLYFFSQATLTRLLERYGFEVIHFDYAGYYRSLDQMLYILLALNRAANSLGTRFYNYLKRHELLDRDIYLNLFDIMFIIGRKRC